MQTQPPSTSPGIGAFTRRKLAWQPRPEPLSIRGLRALLDRTGPAVAPETIERALMRICPTRHELQTYARFDERVYRRNLVYRSDAYEILMLCWRAGQHSPVHDHHGSHCAFAVLTGTAVEVRFARDPGGTLRAVSYQPLPTGCVSASINDDLHAVGNWLTPPRALVTLHVYTPPLAAMRTYPDADVHAVPFERLQQLTAPPVQQHWLELSHWPRPEGAMC